MTPLVAAQASNELRGARAIVRAALSQGHCTVADVLGDPPACVQSMRLCDLVAATRGIGHDKMRQIGAMAARDRVNVMQTVATSSTATRRWIADAVESVGRRGIGL